jgi:hypothetical protein
MTMKKPQFKRSMLALALLGSALQAQSQIVNGGFEAGLSGWTTFGDVSTQGTAPAGAAKLFLTTADLDPDEYSSTGVLIGPFNTSGTGAVLVGTAGGLETLTGNAIGAFDAFGLSAVEGAAATQTFNALAGDTLSFVWNFGTREIALDHAFVVIDGVRTSLNGLVNPTLPGSGDDLAQTGYQSFSSTFTSSGLHKLTFGVVDLNDTAVRSSLSIDQVQISAVPEASSAAMSLLGLAALGMFATRAKRKSRA